MKTPWVKAKNAEDVAMLEAPATVLATPESNAGVSPPFRARIVRIRVKPGETVKRGDVVADVVMPEVVQAAGTYASAATRVGAYERRLAQLEGLKKEGMVRLSELLDVQTKLAEARADQHSALAMLRVAGLAGDDARRLLASRGGEVALRSPIDGVVTQVKAAIGENREAAGEPLVRVAGEGEPRVEARCARVMPRKAEYEIWLATGERHPLREVGHAPQVDPRDGTTLVWFAPAAGTRLVQGQTGKVKIRLEEEEGAVAVPARAVGLGPKGPFLVVNRAGKPERVEVEVVAASGAEALVRGAVKIGDEIAADAAQTELGAAAEAARPPPQDQDVRKEGGT
ncbi:MAG TPA: efflux RND transporter periplasmic adaptor subunit [Anaeromyxobacteraceae bacterium]